MDHYYSSTPNSKSHQQKFEVVINAKNLSFFYDNGVFSKGQIDFGSHLLLNTILEHEPKEAVQILDMGCGYGVIGITLASFFEEASITMADINERAVALSIQNARLNQVDQRTTAIQSNRFEQILSKFDFILTNPPIRAGKSTIFSIYEEAYQHLNVGGRLYVVIRKQQGAESSQKMLQNLFGNCDVIAKKSGYLILRCLHV